MFLLASAVLSVLVFPFMLHQHDTMMMIVGRFSDQGWKASLFLESVALLPQARLFCRTKSIDKLTVGWFLLLMGAYRACFHVKWLYFPPDVLNDFTSTSFQDMYYSVGFDYDDALPERSANYSFGTLRLTTILCGVVQMIIGFGGVLVSCCCPEAVSAPSWEHSLFPFQLLPHSSHSGGNHRICIVYGIVLLTFFFIGLSQEGWESRSAIVVSNQLVIAAMGLVGLVDKQLCFGRIVI